MRSSGWLCGVAASLYRTSQNLSAIKCNETKTKGSKKNKEQCEGETCLDVDMLGIDKEE
jgi:hypothetical protein